MERTKELAQSEAPPGVPGPENRQEPHSWPLWQDVWTWANAVTAIKLPLLVLFPMSGGAPGAELGILALAGVSDLTDGWLARRMGQDKGFGRLLDPICDKLFLLTVVATLLIQQRLGVRELEIVLLRDLYIILVSVFLLVTGRWRQVDLQARFFGKFVTFLQFIFLGLRVLGWPAGWVLVGLFAVSVLACLDYTLALARRLSWRRRR